MKVVKEILNDDVIWGLGMGLMWGAFIALFSPMLTWALGLGFGAVWLWRFGRRRGAA